MQSPAWSRVREDIARLRTWLVEAEVLVDNYSPKSLHAPHPTELHRLESAVKALREFLQQMDARKPVLLAVQLNQMPELSSAGPEIQQQVHDLAERWRRVFQRGRVWQASLQAAFADAAELRSLLHVLSSGVREATEAVLDCQSRAERGPEARRAVANRVRIVEKDLQLTEEKATRWGDYVDVLYAPGLVGGSFGAGGALPSGASVASATAELLSLRHRLRQVADNAREQLRVCTRLLSPVVSVRAWPLSAISHTSAAISLRPSVLAGEVQRRRRRPAVRLSAASHCGELATRGALLRRLFRCARLTFYFHGHNRGFFVLCPP